MGEDADKLQEEIAKFDKSTMAKVDEAEKAKREEEKKKRAEELEKVRLAMEAAAKKE